ncbi:MAG: hypothetical protein Q8P63_01115 [Candidatus Nealsonbacteria bacterium]|nr:hypothetical protein [Candidatus Nealsonbacteria bacterium]
MLNLPNDEIKNRPSPGSFCFKEIWIISWPVWLLLTYLIKVVDWSSQIPLATFAIVNLHWIWLAVFYLILAGAGWRLDKKFGKIR